MIISRKEIDKLSADVRRIIDGEIVDLRDNLEGRLSALKNDIHTLARQLNEQAANLEVEKAAMANALADISHQIKTPLTAMMIMAELLEGAAPEKQAEFVFNLKQGIAQTRWLADALLKMAKLESGSVTLNMADIPASEIISAALAPLAVLLDIKSQKINIVGESIIRCDKNWTAQALTNIVKNASEHSPEGSVITIETGSNPICAWLSVRDMGAGIAPARVRELFRRFGESKHGVGIGLPLSLAIMQRQEGDIEVEADGAGGGACFVLKFYATKKL